VLEIVRFEVLMAMTMYEDCHLLKFDVLQFRT